MRTLNVFDATCIIAGMLIGVGIFKAPSLVASHMASGLEFLLVWVLGGVISIAGALCYAELAVTYPSAGGEYYFITKAFGRNVSFFHAWSKTTVITTGSIAILALTLGDYMTVIYALGEYSNFIWASLAILLITGVNLLGIYQSKWTMNALAIAEILGVLAIVYAGLTKNEIGSLSQLLEKQSESSSYGFAMVFVLLAYGGWNEAAYLSAEVKDERHGIVKSLIWGLGVVMVLYFLTNLAYLNTLGLSGLGQSPAVAYDVFTKAFGKESAVVFSLIVVMSCLNSLHATVLLGSRSAFAMGKDYQVFSWLGHWHPSGNPKNSLIAQTLAAVSLLLVALWTRQGFETAVEFTAPVFWFFISLVGLSLMRLRHIDRDTPRPFKVPFYPTLPLMFISVTCWMFWSSLIHAGMGAWIGVCVLTSGFIPLWLNSHLFKSNLTSPAT